MEYETGVRLDAVLDNQDKQFKIEQYKINLMEAIAEKLDIDIKKMAKEVK